jgi:putative SOS response-associated peptidase YedK
MCGRYVIVSQAKQIEDKFGVKVKTQIQKNYNVSAGQLAPVISSNNSDEVQLMHFGFTPKWSKKRTFIINARAEGDHNKDNNPLYNGAKGILSKPFFRSSIRSKRCLVIADAFIEGTTKEKLDKPYLVYLKDKKRPFAFAGIYDEWINPSDGEIINSFAIITCPPNKLMQRIPHHRMPVIIESQNYSRYLNVGTDLSDITSLLKPYNSNLMNAYPIDSKIKKITTNSKEALKPIGDTIITEKTFEKTEEIKLFGMGESPSRNRE